MSANDEGGTGGGDEEFVTVKQGEAEVKVPVAAFKSLIDKEIKDKYIPVPAHNDQMARLRKQVDGLKDRKTTDELLQDAEFKIKAVAAWGMDPNATNEQLRTQIEKHRTELTEREIKPRDAKLAELQGRVVQYRQKDLRGQIIAAAAALKIEDKYLRAPTKGGKPLIVSMLEDTFGFDEEHTEWFAKGQAGQYAFSTSGGDVPYMTVAEFFSNWVSTDGKDFVRSEKQGGAGTTQEDKDKVPGQSGKEIRLTEEQIRDPVLFRRMALKAEKEGLTIVRI